MPELATDLERVLCCGAACGRTTAEAGPCVAGTYGRNIRRRIEAAGLAVVPAARRGYLSRLGEGVLHQLEDRTRKLNTTRELLIALLAELPGLCAPSDGAIYARDHRGIQVYADVQERIADRIQQWLEAQDESEPAADA